MKSFLRKLPKRFGLGLSSLLLAVTAVAAPFTTAQVVQASSNDSHVSIESDVKVANVTAGHTKYHDSVNAKVDQVVKVQLWFHNREEPGSGKVAENLRAKFNIPSGQGVNQTITGWVQGDNTNKASDTATVKLSYDEAYLDYIEGSAKWRYNKGAYDGRTECQTGEQAVPANDPNSCYATTGISDKVVTNENGVVLNDKMRPCFAYEATVTVLARVKASEVKINKYVSAHDEDHNPRNNDWKLKNDAQPGDKMDYMIRFENKGNTVLEDVVVADNLPDYMSFVPGSTYIINGNFPDGVAAGTDNVYKGGIDVGDYNPGAAGYVVFTVKIDPINVFEECGTYTLKNVGIVQPKGMNEFYNTAWTDVLIKCQNNEQPPEECEEDCEQPEVLPKTGAASVIGFVGAATLAGGLLHRLVLRRKYVA